MKLRYLLSALAGVALLASCVEENPVTSYDLAISLDKSTVGVTSEGGTATVKVNSGETVWTASTEAKWIEFTPKTGTGETEVTITVGAFDEDRTGEILIKAAGLERILTVVQTGNPHGLLPEDPLSVEEAVAICDKLNDKEKAGKKYYVKGIISKMVQSYAESGEYGNATFWISDKGDAEDFEVYRALYKGGAKYGEYSGEDKVDVGKGDEVVIYGIIMNYGGTAETSANEAYLYSIKSNTDPIISSKEATKVVPAAAESVTFEIECKNLTEGWTVTTEADWITSYTTSGTKDETAINVEFAANTVEEERTATFTVKSAGAPDLVLTLKQEAWSPITDINCAGLNALEDGEAYYRVKGVITQIVMDKTDPAKYNAYGNFYIADETGVVYVYGLLPQAGGATKQDVLTTKGIKVGDVITVVGPKGSYKEAPQMVNAYYEAHIPVTTTTCEAFNALADGDDLFLLKGSIQNIVMDKNDATKYNKYGNFDVVDASGKVYVYGIVPVMTGASGQDILTTLGVKAGDIVTVVGRKGSYKEAPQMVNGYLVGVEPGTPAPPALFLNEFDTLNKKIEIYNSTDAAVDMTGWLLVKDGGLEEKDIFTIPAALANVPAKGYAVFTCKQDDAANGPLFGLSGKKGFKIELKKGDVVVDVVDNLTTITEIPDGKSWGRETDGAETFVLFDTPTIGASNGAAPAPAALSITEILALEKGAEFTAQESLVVAKTTKGVVVSDGAKAVYAYGTAVDNVNVGDKIVFAGKKTVYNGVHELESLSAVEVKSTGNEVAYPEAKDITAEVATYTNTEAEFVSLTGQLSVSGNYYNMTIEGVDSATKQGSIVYPVAALNAADFNGKVITVTGYFNGLSSQSKYVNVIATKIEEVQGAEPTPTISASDISDVPAAGVAGATTTVTFTANEGWTASVTPDGTVVTAASIEGTTITYTVAENTATEAREGKITVTLKKDGKDDVTKDIKVSQLAAAAAGVDELVLDIIEYAKANGWQYVDTTGELHETFTYEGFTFTASWEGDNKNGIFYTTAEMASGDWRFYQARKGGIKIDAPAGKELVSAKFTFKTKNSGDVVMYGETALNSNDVAQISGSSAFFTVGSTAGKTNAQARISKITLTYKDAEAAGPSFAIDGDFSEWENVDALTSVGNRFKEWKYASDSENIYFYYKIDASKIKSDGSSKIYIGFDMDKDPSTGAQGEYGAAGTSGSFSITESGLEALAYFYPWDGTTAVVAGGELSDSFVQCPVGTETGKVTMKGSISGGDAFIELSITRASIGSPAAGTSVIVNHAMQYYPTGRTVITL